MEKSRSRGNFQGGSKLRFPLPECEVAVGHLNENVRKTAREGFPGSGQGKDGR